jgi:hypothetical protein
MTDRVRNKQSKRIDHNFGELLQEFRVAQQGVQILFAFLLSLPFQSRFPILTHEYQKWLYSVALMSAFLSTILFITPVSHHRILFHQGLKAVIVDFASLIAQAALALLMTSMLTAIFLIFGVVLNLTMAVALTTLGAVVWVIFWYVMAIRFRRAKDE